MSAITLLTEEQLRFIVGDAVRAVLNHELPQPEPQKDKKYIYGIGGLARLMGCSRPTAQKLKDSGKIPYTQVGRKILFEESKVLDALSSNK